MSRPIIDFGVALRWIVTAMLIIVAKHIPTFCWVSLIISSVFCEIYWYLWQREKAR